MAYADEVLADSPWAYWKFTEDPDGYWNRTDSSGNGRTMNLSTTGVWDNAAVVDRGLYLGANTTYGRSSASMRTSSATVEAWVKVEALPTGQSPIMSCYTNSLTFDKALHLTPAGEFGFYVFDGAAQRILTPPIVTPGTWYHVVASVGPDGAKIRVDGVTEAYAPTVTGSAAGVDLLVAIRQVSGTMGTGNGDLNARAVFTIAGPAFYTTQLSDTRTDAHFTAAGGAPPAPTGALAVTLPALAADLSGTYTAPPPPTYTGDLAATLPAVEASLSGTYQAPPVGNLSATLPALTVDLAGAYTAPAGAAPLGTLDATLPGLTATLSGTYAAPVEVIPVGTLDATLPGLAAALTGAYVGPTFTATSTRYANDGYNYDGVAEVDYEPPVAEPPAHIRRAKVRHVHQAMPAPTLENGRPV